MLFNEFMLEDAKLHQEYMINLSGDIRLMRWLKQKKKGVKQQERCCEEVLLHQTEERDIDRHSALPSTTIPA